MYRNVARLVALVLLLPLFQAALPAPAHAETPAKYVILFHGDGMGAGHIQAGAYYVCGSQPCFAFESFPYQTTMTTTNVSGQVTDSAAAATAMATGVKVNNYVVSVQIPGDGHELTSILEKQRDAGKSTGLVTESAMTDASPAAHGAHETSRDNGNAIFLDYVNQSQPNVLLGGGGLGFNSTAATSAGYTVVSNVSGLNALNTEAATRVAGGFGTSGLIPPVGYPGRDPNLPTLPQMTEKALAILDNDPNGFYLFVEHEGMDEYSENSDATNVVRSMEEFADALQVAVDWVNRVDPTWENTLFVVLGDHETGGITNVVNKGAGYVPTMTFSSGGGHTANPVRVFAKGVGAQQFPSTQIDNTQIAGFLSPPGTVIKPPTGAPAALSATAVSSSQIDLAWTYATSNEDGFRIERSPNGTDSWVTAGTVSLSARTFRDSGLAASTTYHYQVRAYNIGGSTDPSNIVSATTMDPQSMHVGDLDGASTVAKRSWTATVTITVHGPGEQPVSRATVTGSWSAGTKGSASCVTNSDGVCQVSKSSLKTTVGSVTFTVTGVAQSAYIYDRSANHDDEPDSEGTFIVVNR